MKVVTAQLNYTIGDFANNAAKIINVINLHGASTDLIVFTELCVSGYYPKDLFHRPGFIEAQNEAIDQIIQCSKNKKAAIVIGHFRHNYFGGKAFYNSLSLIERCKVSFLG